MRTGLLIFTIFQLLPAILRADEPARAANRTLPRPTTYWHPYAIRDEIRPDFDSKVDASGNDTLIITGGGNASADGRWLKRVAVTEGKYVLFTAHYRAKRVETPTRSIIASILWFDDNGNQVEQAEFPMTVRAPAPRDLKSVTGTYKVPAKVKEAELQLRLRWAPEGEVEWSDIDLKETRPPAPRKVKVASINHRPRNTNPPQANLDQFSKLIDDAGAKKADIICLPEGITVCGTGLTYAQVAQPIPGPATEFLGQCAARNKSYLVAGLYERDGKTLYNTSVLLSRDGKLLGKYRKVCLPREEIDGGITPGHDYPVFDTDFGRIGMMICWDISYPEVARELSARGAEMIFMPIWGGNETLAKARAIENQIYLVASGYDFRTAIYDKSGDAISKSPDSTNIIYADIDLNQRLLWPWLGDWRSRIFLEGPARPETN
ncbi:MAG TPA: carbon-nitrogen hydrolase family protein [Tepidisphaeraceae bacterium]|nr:carbon-nitrogen hydrolase family protein [Tepidisphaeraceae bacterium]